MLEPRIYTTTIVDGTISHVIDVRFKMRDGKSQPKPSRSTCSNLSLHATSSVTFFDRDNNNTMNLDSNKVISGQVNRDEVSVRTIDIDRNFMLGRGPFKS